MIRINDSLVVTFKQIRLAIIKYLAEFRLQSLNDVLLGSKPLKAATAVPAETKLEAQVRQNTDVTQGFSRIISSVPKFRDEPKRQRQMMEIWHEFIKISPSKWLNLLAKKTVP